MKKRRGLSKIICNAVPARSKMASTSQRHNVQSFSFFTCSVSARRSPYAPSKATRWHTNGRFSTSMWTIPDQAMMHEESSLDE